MVQRRALSLPAGLWWLVLPAAAALVLSGCSASDAGATATSASPLASSPAPSPSPSAVPFSSKYPNAEDLVGEGKHLSVSGHRKQAALEWRVLGLDS